MPAPLILPEQIDTRSTLRPGQHVGEAEVDDGLVLVDELAARALALNPSAALIWRCLDGVAPLGEIIEDLSEAFGVDTEVVGHDVVATVQDLGAFGLLEGVAIRPELLPVEIQYVGDADCTEPADATGTPALGERYLAVPPDR